MSISQVSTSYGIDSVATPFTLTQISTSTGSDGVTTPLTVTAGTEFNSSATVTTTAPSASGPQANKETPATIPTPNSISSTTTTSASSASIASSATAKASPSSSQKQSSSGNFSTGTLAGGIVGAFVGGCLLAFLIAFLFRRRRRRRSSVTATRIPTTKGPASASVQPTHHSAISYGTKDAFEAPRGFAAIPFKTPSIPPPADDQTVSTKIESLYDQINLHIDNYYVRLDEGLSSASSAKADAIGHYDSSLLPGSLVFYLSKSKTQRAALTHALAYRLLEAIRPENNSACLLPPFFRWAPSTMQVVPSKRDSQDEYTFAWRMIVSHLNTLNPPDPSIQHRTLDSLTQDFIKTFSEYRNLEFSESSQSDHLSSVIKATSDLGIWLFSQPCAFQLDWGSGTASRSPNELMTFPSVFKISDEQGRRLQTIQKVVEERRIRV